VHEDSGACRPPAARDRTSTRNSSDSPERNPRNFSTRLVRRSWPRPRNFVVGSDEPTQPAVAFAASISKRTSCKDVFSVGVRRIHQVGAVKKLIDRGTRDCRARIATLLRTAILLTKAIVTCICGRTSQKNINIHVQIRYRDRINFTQNRFHCIFRIRIERPLGSILGPSKGSRWTVHPPADLNSCAGRHSTFVHNLHSKLMRMSSTPANVTSAGRKRPTGDFGTAEISVRRARTIRGAFASRNLSMICVPPEELSSSIRPGHSCSPDGRRFVSCREQPE
jgi:hypothetical protein